MSLSDRLKKSGLKKLPQRKPNPLPLRPDLLLHPNIPMPLHGRNPRTINGVNWWNRERRKVYKSTEFHCLACGTHKEQARSRQWLEAHELYEIDYEKGIAVFTEVVPLCHYCHSFIHSGRLQTLLEQGKLHHSKFVSIIQHGDRILKEAGLTKKSHFERDRELQEMIANGLVAEWSRWRLKFEGKLYRPLFPTEEAYRKYWDANNSEE